ncbi:hypothetical protein LUZ63_001703 [Rhynchospora breviuscula]|uniref:CBS domain-containing protein n=1 Tax=Rhynchospora breviuscula TaxID=2022672 RepID=A0A9Q0HX58_9POAL|nr:hypothetical protein LUZ63_001703 [Rhynchospora breviuscula]
MAFSISLHRTPLLHKHSDIIPQLPINKGSFLVPVSGPISKRHVALAMGDMRPAIDEYPEGIISGEWTENFSFLSYKDLLAYLESQIKNTDKMSPASVLKDVMSRPVLVARAEQRLEEIDQHFKVISGLPVVDADSKCIGVISKKDKAKASNEDSTVGEVMSSPAITLSHKKTVLDAAVLMLKKKIHRIPVVNDKQEVVGIVTRSDVFQALEAVAQ